MTRQHLLIKPRYDTMHFQDCCSKATFHPIQSQAAFQPMNCSLCGGQHVLLFFNAFTLTFIILKTQSLCQVSVLHLLVYLFAKDTIIRCNNILLHFFSFFIPIKHPPVCLSHCYILIHSNLFSRSSLQGTYILDRPSSLMPHLLSYTII